MISSEFIRDHHRSCLLAQMIVSIQRLHTDGLLVVSNRGDRQLTTVASGRVFPVGRSECSINAGLFRATQLTKRNQILLVEARHTVMLVKFVDRKINAV